MEIPNQYLAYDYIPTGHVPQLGGSFSMVDPMIIHVPCMMARGYPYDLGNS